MITIVVGGQFGDEGKGKIVSYLATGSKYSAIARAGTGPNAGHTVVHHGQTYKLQLLPSGFFNKDLKLYVGAGVLVNPSILLNEIKETNTSGRVFVDYHTGIIEQNHIDRDRKDDHLHNKIGSTGTGCGPANEDRASRKLKLAREMPELKQYLIDVSNELNDLLEQGKDIIIEGSQATHLSLIHGTYPFVTSKDVTAPTCLADVGVGPTYVDEVIVVFKGFTTRVGTGPLNGELSEEEVIKRGWTEYGTVTGRLRRAAPFDYTLAKKSVRLNGATAIALTKLDVLFPEVKSATTMDKLTPEAIKFIESVESETGVPVKYLSTGPGSDELIIREN